MMFFCSFISDILNTIAGGAILALLFFLSREKFFPLPEITGQWYYQITTTESKHKPFEGMILRYIVILWREGSKIRGTIEKIYEDSSTGEREYVGKNRTRGKIEGYMEKNYLGKDRIFMHIVEYGHGRESTSYFELTVVKSVQLIGEFSSMVGGQKGHVKWQRNEF